MYKHKKHRPQLHRHKASRPGHELGTTGNARQPGLMNRVLGLVPDALADVPGTIATAASPLLHFARAVVGYVRHGEMHRARLAVLRLARPSHT